jgi:hypothetical protein
VVALLPTRMASRQPGGMTAANEQIPRTGGKLPRPRVSLLGGRPSPSRLLRLPGGPPEEAALLQDGAL